MFQEIVTISTSGNCWRSLFGCLIFAQALVGQCNITLAAYSPSGNPLLFRVNDVKDIEGQGKSIAHYLAGSLDKSYLHRQQLVFPKLTTGLKLGLELILSDETSYFKPIVLLHCGLTHTVTLGELDGGDDMSTIPVFGKLSGCRINGLEWIRAIPMFGPIRGVEWAEAEVNQADCSFRLSLSTLGVRHIFIVGKGKQSLGTFDKDIVRGSNNNLGIVNTWKKSPIAQE